MTSSAHRYEHTQVGVPTLAITGVAQAGIVIAAAASRQWAILWLLPFFVLVDLLFFRLRVTVGEGTARAVFGTDDPQGLGAAIEAERGMA